ncbi:MAG: hypothetical protein OHK0017_09200 [Patescibacteria group bacterium]
MPYLNDKLYLFLKSAVFMRFDNSQGLWYLEIKGNQFLRKFSSLETHFILYPFNRQIDADDILFRPFDDYYQDVTADLKSVYFKIPKQADKAFGLILALTIGLFFYWYNVAELNSIESIASIIGSYIVGKELWTDIEYFLVNTTRRWSLRFYPRQYSLQRESRTTLSEYTNLARKIRFGQDFPLPNKIELVKQSYSHLLKMFYRLADYNSLKRDDFVRLVSIEVQEKVMSEFRSKQTMLGVKIALNKNLLGMTWSQEFFQAWDRGEPGCINGTGAWMPEAVFMRSSFCVGNIKFYESTKTISQLLMVNWE